MKRKSRSGQEYPKKIEGRNSWVKIYRKQRDKDGVTYVEFVLKWHEGKKGARPRERSFANEIAAKAEADRVVERLDQGFREGDALSATDRQDHALAKKELAGFPHTPVSTVCREYAAAMRTLAGNASLAEAAKFFMAHFNPMKSTATVRVILDDWEQRKKKDASAAHVHTMVTICGGIADHFGAKPLADIKAHELDDYIDSCGGSKRTRYNIRAAAITLWRFAKARRHLPREKITEAELTQPIEGGKKVGKVRIYSPEALGALIAKQSFETLPWVVVGAFSGVRSYEIPRLRWRDFKWARGIIDVPAEDSETGERVTKTRDRRLVPITPALAAFLAPYRDRPADELLSFGYARMHEAAKDRALRELRDGKGKVVMPRVPWIKNGLRHSFCSYRLADVKSIGQVAEESGNSEEVIKSNYREVVMPEDAKAYWALRPVNLPSTPAAPEPEKPEQIAAVA